MNQELFKNFSEQFQQVVSPLTQMNQLMADNIEQLSKLQLESLQAYNDLGIEQIKSLAAVKDPQSFTAHSARQMELLSKVSERLLEDGKKLSEMGQNFQHAADKFAKATGEETA